MHAMMNVKMATQSVAIKFKQFNNQSTDTA